MELKIDSAALQAVEEAIDAHFTADQTRWEDVMRAVAGCIPGGIQRRVERHEGCTFSEWLDETLYKWDGRSVTTLVPLLQKRLEKVP